MSGVEGKAENIGSLGVFRILTHLIHERLAGCEFRRPLASGSYSDGASVFARALS
jgi:hypothetical protein